MRRTIGRTGPRWLLIAGAGWLPFWTAAAAPQQEPPVRVLTAALLEFKAGAGADSADARVIEAELKQALTQSPELVLINSPESTADAAAARPADTVDSIEAAEIGRSSGVELVITGRVLKVRDQYVLLGKLMSTTTSRIYGEMVQAGINQPLRAAACELAEKILRTAADQSAELAPDPQPRAEVLKRLSKFIGAANLPEVEVLAGGEPESAAAAAAVQSLLRELGFPSTGGSAGIKVAAAAKVRTLDASELDLEQARLELTAGPQAPGADGPPFFREQQTIIAGSAKGRNSALERAVLLLAERLILRLLQRGLIAQEPRQPSSKIWTAEDVK